MMSPQLPFTIVQKSKDIACIKGNIDDWNRLQSMSTHMIHFISLASGNTG